MHDATRQPAYALDERNPALTDHNFAVVVFPSARRWDCKKVARQASFLRAGPKRWAFLSGVRNRYRLRLERMGQAPVVAEAEARMFLHGIEVELFEIRRLKIRAKAPHLDDEEVDYWAGPNPSDRYLPMHGTGE